MYRCLTHPRHRPSRYDPGNDRWFIGPALSSRRFALGGAAIDSALYAVGGYDGETYLNTVERLDPREGRCVVRRESVLK